MTQTYTLIGHATRIEFYVLINDKDFDMTRTQTYRQMDPATRAQFHGSAYRQIRRLWLRFPAYVQAPNFCASLVSVECLVMWSTHAQKLKFAANPWNTLAISTEFPASVCAVSVLMVSRAMKLGPELEFDVLVKYTNVNWDVTSHLALPCYNKTLHWLQTVKWKE